MMVPLTLQAQMLPRRDVRQVTDNSRKSLGTQNRPGCKALPGLRIRTQTQNRISIFRVVKGDPLNRTGKVIHSYKYTRQIVSLNFLKVEVFNPMLQRKARQKLEILDAVEKLDDLKIPPGNRLEKLSGNRRLPLRR